MFRELPFENLIPLAPIFVALIFFSIGHEWARRAEARRPAPARVPPRKTAR